MARHDTWMPFYIGDYLGDTQRLSTEQHGAYLLLILDYWRNGPAPDDDAVLQQITKLDRPTWKKHRPILARFFQIEDGEWRHKRIDQELLDAEANAGRRSSKAKAAAEARWGASKSNAPSNAPSIPEAVPVECASPSPSPSQRVDDDDDGGACAGARPPVIEPIDHLLADCGRAAGVRLVEPGRIAEAVGLLREWLALGLSGAEIIEIIRARVRDATEPIRSLRYFDAAIRHAIACQEADAHVTPTAERYHRRAATRLDPMAAAVLAEARGRPAGGRE